MSIADYVILVVIALAAVGAVAYGRRHPGGCGGNCAGCKRGCEKKDAKLPGPGSEPKE